ncbi:MAG TPA: HlyD family efflux transporter periplasmic adaptor subunit [Steroidobacteraceae bacterium]|jgi:HlyD family secretion protein|nr:HlyD family efflux transporter periplasmic adaptor subunit [Steroidobacteraceae bacterium]
MDKTIEKKPAPLRRWIVIGVAAVALLTVGWQVLSRTTGGSRLKIDSSRLTTAVVQNGEFLEYYPFDGTVQPATSVFLDIEGGGRVDQIFVEGGQHVEKGDLILRFSNASLRQGALNTETQLLYNLDIQRTTVFNRQQSTLLLRDALLDLDHQILDVENKFRRYDVLMKNGNTAISVAEFEITRDQLKYLKDRRELMAERIRREDELAEKQLAQANRAIEKLNTGIGMIGQIVASLDVRAPIAGWLSTIDAQIGQNIPAGKRIGQIDLLDKFKVRVKIDQYYISRVEIGTRGHVDLDGKTWEVAVQKIYPEVTASAFEADVVFEGENPPGIKRGQTLTVELSFGTPSRSLKVAKGGFYQQTSGRWVYLVSEDGRGARRTNVRLGRQNPREVEVLEGLREGDRIITSGYDTYNGVNELRFNEAIKIKQGKKS